MPKGVRFHGDALERLRELSDDLGHQIWQVQKGLDPDDWKPMKTVGPGVREIRVKDDSGAYRAIYLATLPDAVHVYHVFQKKTQKTPKKDLDTAKARYKEHMRSLKK
jgi:phage-related protein